MPSEGPAIARREPDVTSSTVLADCCGRQAGQAPERCGAGRVCFFVAAPRLQCYRSETDILLRAVGSWGCCSLGSDLAVQCAADGQGPWVTFCGYFR